MILQQSKWDYDRLGNLLYMNDINGNKLYTYDNVKKQQPIQIGNENIVHDARGNVLRTSAYEINWSSFSKPLSIKTNKSTTNYEYGPSRERVLKSTNNQTLLVHYIEDVYEKWTSVDASNLVQTTEKFYIKVLNKIIATKIVTRSGESKLFYMYNDPYGSVESITDQKGALLLKYTYTPFGFRTVSYSNISADVQPYLNLGFSSNDYNDVDERLVIFKGRVYDCVFARFISPDPFIQEPYNIQDLNRYSYGLNNPFKYNDPSGFFFKKLWNAITNPRVIVAVIAAVATAGALAPIAASIGAAVTTSAIGASMVTGAIIGAGSGFASSYVLSNGNMDAALKGGIMGGLTGGLGAGFSKSMAGSLTTPSLKFAGDTVFNGVANRLSGRKFFDGFDMALVSYGAANAYKNLVGYKVTYESGGPTDFTKGEWTPPTEGANNIGIQGRSKPAMFLGVDWK